jgi:hypothetical protein
MHVRNANARNTRTSATWVPQRNARHVRKLGTPMHVCNANARHARTSTTWVPKRNARHVQKLGAQTQRKASSQGGRPNEKLILNENVHTREHLAKRRPAGWIRTNFWLGGRIFNTASPRLGAPTQREACPQDGRPNAMQGASARWAPKRTSPMQTQLTSITQGMSPRPQLGRCNATQGTSASWTAKRNARRVCKMGGQTKNSSATKTSTQGSTRQKDELEDG